MAGASLEMQDINRIREEVVESAHWQRPQHFWQYSEFATSTCSVHSHQQLHRRRPGMSATELDCVTGEAEVGCRMHSLGSSLASILFSRPISTGNKQNDPDHNSPPPTSESCAGMVIGV
jgi:hypothetical protein